MIAARCFYIQLPVFDLTFCKIMRKLVVVAGAAVLAACQSSALEPYRKSGKYELSVVQGEPFRHQIVVNAQAQKQVSQLLSVYIEGDGRPWFRRNQVAWDPTPEKPMMLELMAQDSGAAVYLGRPCYFGLEDPACSEIWWTHKRYAPEVVESMNQVLDELVQDGQPLRLVGHSGGGALAVLMAGLRNDVETVVTLAGNLDIEKWANLHGYSPLKGSMNPADADLPPEIRQFHFVGDADPITPPDLVRSGMGGNASLEILEGVNHLCCWTDRWPLIEQRISAD